MNWLPRLTLLSVCVLCIGAGCEGVLACFVKLTIDDHVHVVYSHIDTLIQGYKASNSISIDTASID